MNMESEKRSNSSETSSEEHDHHPAEKFKDDNTGVGRFYECNFCKRGFTNAQALGGHMNIHRKEKAKAKQKAQKSLFSNKTSEECMIPRYYESISSEQAQYHAVPVVGRMNYQFYDPASNPNFSLGYHQSDFPAAPRPEHLSLFEDNYDPKMSLRIQHPHEEDVESRKNNWGENELDLELRLG